MKAKPADPRYALVESLLPKVQKDSWQQDYGSEQNKAIWPALLVLDELRHHREKLSGYFPAVALFGYRAEDDEFMGSLASQLKSKGKLSPKQTYYARKCLLRDDHWQQLGWAAATLTGTKQYESGELKAPACEAWSLLLAAKNGFTGSMQELLEKVRKWVSGWLTLHCPEKTGSPWLRLKDAPMVGLENLNDAGGAKLKDHDGISFDAKKFFGFTQPIQPDVKVGKFLDTPFPVVAQKDFDEAAASAAGLHQDQVDHLVKNILGKSDESALSGALSMKKKFETTYPSVAAYAVGVKFAEKETNPCGEVVLTGTPKGTSLGGKLAGYAATGLWADPTSQGMTQEQFAASEFGKYAVSRGFPADPAEWDAELVVKCVERFHAEQYPGGCPEKCKECEARLGKGAQSSAPAHLAAMGF